MQSVKTSYWSMKKEKFMYGLKKAGKMKVCYLFHKSPNIIFSLIN